MGKLVVKIDHNITKYERTRLEIDAADAPEALNQLKSLIGGDDLDEKLAREGTEFREFASFVDEESYEFQIFDETGEHLLLHYSGSQDDPVVAGLGMGEAGTDGKQGPGATRNQGNGDRPTP